MDEQRLNIFPVWPDLNNIFLFFSIHLYLFRKTLSRDEPWWNSLQSKLSYSKILCTGMWLPITLSQSQVSNQKPHSTKSADPKGCCWRYSVWTVTTPCETWHGQITWNCVKYGIKEIFLPFFFFNPWMLLSFHGNY